MVEISGAFGLHDDVRVSVSRIGAELAPVIVVENFLSNAQQLVELAASDATFEPVAGIVYPGDRAPLPPQYDAAFRDHLGKIIGETFGLDTTNVQRRQNDFSMVAVRPEKLQPAQRVPHFDGTEPAMIAAVHFLCAPGQGGTSFYRHRRTGFESIDESRKASYFRALNEEARILGPSPAAYINGSGPQFERIASFDAAFNRMLIYRGKVLHSGNIARDFRIDSNPRTGRLTANSFYLFA